MRRVPLLTRRRQISGQPRPDQVMPRPQRRHHPLRDPASRWRRRRQRLPHRAPMHMMLRRSARIPRAWSRLSLPIRSNSSTVDISFSSFGGQSQPRNVGTGRLGVGATSNHQSGPKWGHIRLSNSGATHPWLDLRRRADGGGQSLSCIRARRVRFGRQPPSSDRSVRLLAGGRLLVAASADCQSSQRSRPAFRPRARAATPTPGFGGCASGWLRQDDRYGRLQGRG